jgi:hypothetical protein
MRTWKETYVHISQKERNGHVPNNRPSVNILILAHSRHLICFGAQYGRKKMGAGGMGSIGFTGRKSDHSVKKVLQIVSPVYILRESSQRTNRFHIFGENIQNPLTNA